MKNLIAKGKYLNVAAMLRDMYGCVYDWDNDEDGLDMFRATGLSLVYANRDFIHLDGKKIGMPAWQTAW